MLYYWTKERRCLQTRPQIKDNKPKGWTVLSVIRILELPGLEAYNRGNERNLLASFYPWGQQDCLFDWKGGFFRYRKDGTSTGLSVIRIMELPGLETYIRGNERNLLASFYPWGQQDCLFDWKGGFFRYRKVS
ncbi:hypothetical protein CDAR_229521 [Caerostris darwini]|uniref:Uncharacterized protein n=1 Tax=Caerostris darwini TaxID=1538125 RepID=A0AAV4PYD9_9ARAC|nr:hypothetical protein CDAR_229521 [Caerostris darwini]